ncbi:MAG TPA: hypothetical protein VJ797_15740 [Burkholderiales bacterium]|nr:hypothetical protein [Burkholderiales bacterium]
MNHEFVSLPAADVLRAVSAQTLARELFERISNGRAAPIGAQRALPAIGGDFEGGIYAGLTLVDNTPFALVLLPGEAEEINWKDARAWAEKQGGMLPSRIDALMLFENLKDSFKPEWHWTGTPSAGDEAYAWIQLFYDGTQLTNPKSSHCRARAVRRVAI